MIYSDIDNIVATTLHTVDLLKPNKNWWDALLLYFELIKHRRKQDNNQVYATNDFLCKWLWWWLKKLQKCKKVLEDLKLVNIIEKRMEDWTYKYFIKVNYCISTDGHFTDNGDTASGEVTTKIPLSKKIKHPSVNNKTDAWVFEVVWKLYPHARQAQKQDTKKYYEHCQYTKEEIQDELKLLKRQIKTGKQDWKYLPAMQRRMRDFVPSHEEVKKQFLKECLQKLPWTKHREEFNTDRWKETLKPIRDEMKEHERLNEQRRQLNNLASNN